MGGACRSQQRIQSSGPGNGTSWRALMVTKEGGCSEEVVLLSAAKNAHRLRRVLLYHDGDR